MLIGLSNISNMLKNCQLHVFQPILVVIFVTIATVKATFIRDFYTNMRKLVKSDFYVLEGAKRRLTHVVIL